MRKAIRFGLAGMLAAGLLSAAPAAIASGGGGREVRTHGGCSAASTWKMKAKTDNGRIELEFEVDQNKVGDTWNVKITDNGTKVFQGQRVTQAPSGSFEVRKRVPNQAGTDKFKANATNVSTGETCLGALSF